MSTIHDIRYCHDFEAGTWQGDMLRRIEARWGKVMSDCPWEAPEKPWAVVTLRTAGGRPEVWLDFARDRADAIRVAGVCIYDDGGFLPEAIIDVTTGSGAYVVLDVRLWGTFTAPEDAP